MSPSTLEPLATTNNEHGNTGDIVDLDACAALAPSDRVISIMRAGQLVNRVSWHGQLALLTCNDKECRIAFDALGQLVSAVMPFTTPQKAEAIGVLIESERNDFADYFSGRFLEDYAAITERLNDLSDQHPEDLNLHLIEERKRFVEPIGQIVTSLKTTLQRSLRGGKWRIFRLGERIDQGRRPVDAIYRGVYAPSSHARRNSPPNLRPISSASLSSGPMQRPRRRDPHAASIRWGAVTAPEESDRLLGNHVIAPGELLPLPGWREEIIVAWSIVLRQFQDPTTQNEGTKELVRQLNMLLYGQETVPRSYTIPGPSEATIVVDLTKRAIEREGYTRVEFRNSKKKFDLVVALLERSGEPCPASDLMSTLWKGMKPSLSTRNRLDSTKNAVNKLLAQLGIRIASQAGQGFVIAELPAITPKAASSKQRSRKNARR